MFVKSSDVSRSKDEYGMYGCLAIRACMDVLRDTTYLDLGIFEDDTFFKK